MRIISFRPLRFFRPKQQYGGAAYPGYTLMEILCRAFIAFVAVTMVYSVVTGDPKEAMRKLEEQRADALVAEVREEQFRECLRKASGYGVATTSQMNKCKDQYLEPHE